MSSGGGGSSSGGDESSSVASSGGGSDDDEDEEHKDLAKRRAAKLDALAEEVSEKEKALAENKTDDMREKLLETNEDMNFAPSLKRKKLQSDDENQNKSLLTSLMASKTPPHEFSKKLDLKPTKGKIIFPTNAEDQSGWQPPEGARHPNEGAFLVELDNFDIAKASNGQGNNTIAIKFHAPIEAKRFRYVYYISIWVFVYTLPLDVPAVMCC